MPNIMEFSKLVHVKNARGMASHMPLFFKNKLFCGPQKPQFSQLQGMICWDVQVKPVWCPGLDVSVSVNMPSVALHVHRFLPDSSEHSPAP